MQPAANNAADLHPLKVRGIQLFFGELPLIALN
jgi:hypothetical protein